MHAAVIMGHASTVAEIVSHFASQVDENAAPYSRLYFDDKLKSSLGVVYDTKRALFQNVDASAREIMLSFQDNGDAKVFNIMHNSYPSIIYGSDEGRLMLNYLGNYIGKAWSAESGCQRSGCTIDSSLLVS
ncbi:unnamed protein product [Gongylonema pulchrum]|uniref:Nicastrin n=1 Tax=Gongylonema pulchrum TaxID=637853 RepID=A0A183ERG0_9BILA|nr:unnamed protein product [Gongylonema pulchrum]